MQNLFVRDTYISMYIYGNIPRISQIENAPPVQLPKLKSNYRMNEWQFQNLSSMFKRHSSIFSDASWKLDCGFKGRERYTIWQSLELAQIPGTFCLSKLEPPCEQTYWGGSIFFNCQLFIIWAASQKHFGWSSGAPNPNFYHFYPQLAIFGNFLRRSRAFL